MNFWISTFRTENFLTPTIKGYYCFFSTFITRHFENAFLFKQSVLKMSKVSEEGFLFIHSGVFDREQIELNLSACIKKLDCGECDMYINVVENKDGMKFGHTYAWISDTKIYNALIGKNFDGSDRYEMVDDENWKEPEEDMDDLIDEAGDDWGLIGEIESRYECPKIKVDQEPLVVPPGIKYTEKQKKMLETEDDFGFIEIYPARVTIRTEENKINAIYSSCIPDWVNENMLYGFFKKFNKDSRHHIDPKTKKKFQYPKIIISKNKTKSKWRINESSSNIQIIFSPLNKNLSYFLINVIKKIKITNPKTNKDEMLFFSQAKSRT